MLWGLGGDRMRLIQKVRILSVFFIVFSVVMLTTITTAFASDVTFAVIGPHEYDLPVDYTLYRIL